MIWTVCFSSPARPFYHLFTLPLELNVCLIDSLGNMWISCLCLYSSPNLSLQNQSELVLRDSPQFSYIRSLCLTVLHLHSEFLVTPCVDPFCRKPLLNTRRYLWCFQPLECPDFHHSVNPAHTLSMNPAHTLTCITSNMWSMNKAWHHWVTYWV